MTTLARKIWKALPGLAAGTLALGMLAAACESTGDEPVGTIKIGHYGSLTGAEATFGKSTDNGIKLAVQEANAKGGILVNVTGTNEKGEITITRKMCRIEL